MDMVFELMLTRVLWLIRSPEKVPDLIIKVKRRHKNLETSLPLSTRVSDPVLAKFGSRALNLEQKEMFKFN